MFQNWYSEYLLTAGLKWMKFCSNRFASNVSSVWKPIWRGLLISWQELWIILVSSKFLVFLVLLDLFINKIASYNQEYLLPRYFLICYSFQNWNPSWVLKYRLKNGLNLFEQLFVFLCFCLFTYIFHIFVLASNWNEAQQSKAPCLHLLGSDEPDDHI